MGDSPYYRRFPQLRLPLSFDEWQRLPRNPAFRYEYSDGEAILSPRPYTRAALLPLDAFQPVRLRRPPTLRTLRDGDWKRLPGVMHAAFARELPFNCMSERRAKTLARECLQYTRNGGDGELVPDACIVVERDGVEGAALVTLVEPRLFDDETTHLPSGKLPHLTWIFVSQFGSRQGRGAALLQEVVTRLKTLDYSVLSSTFLIGSTSSAMWHWQMGFQLLSSGRSRIYHQNP